MSLFFSDGSSSEKEKKSKRVETLEWPNSGEAKPQDQKDTRTEFHNSWLYQGGVKSFLYLTFDWDNVYDNLSLDCCQLSPENLKILPSAWTRKSDHSVLCPYPMAWNASLLNPAVNCWCFRLIIFIWLTLSILGELHCFAILF